MSTQLKLTKRKLNIDERRQLNALLKLLENPIFKDQVQSKDSNQDQKNYLSEET